MHLADYIAGAARERFAWGERDCALFLADWVRVVRGRDPAQEYRGTYSCEASAASAAGRGGLVGIVARCARRCGLRRVSEPVVGDIGIITDPSGRTYGAIRTASGWAARTATGIVVASARVVTVRAAWRV